jgi:O-antigen/teichoic acid export membrane protein
MRVRAGMRRAGWNIVDQSVSSLSNLLVSLLIARSVDETAFGGFTIAFTIFTLLTGFSRACVTFPLGVRFADATAEKFAFAAASALGCSLVLALIAGACCVGAGLLIGGAPGAALIALGIVFSGLILQEAWRNVFIAVGRASAAALNTVFWAVAQLIAVWALLTFGKPTIFLVVLVWGGSAMAAALLGIAQSGIRPRPRRAARWLWENRGVSGYVGYEYLTVQGSYQVTLLLIAAVASLQANGALRGAQVLLGPVTMLVASAVRFAVPEFARRRATLTPRQWLLGSWGIAAVGGLAGLAWGLIFVLAPDWLGYQLLGATWPGARDILWVTIIANFALSLSTGPYTMLFAMDRAKVTMVVHTLFAPLVLILGVGGAALDGARGATAGFALAYLVAAPLWWRQLRREVGRCESVLVARAG